MKAPKKFKMLKKRFCFESVRTSTKTGRRQKSKSLISYKSFIKYDNFNYTIQNAKFGISSYLTTLVNFSSVLGDFSVVNLVNNSFLIVQI